MPTIDTIANMTDAEIKEANRKLSRHLAARILVPVAVGVAAHIVIRVIGNVIISKL